VRIRINLNNQKKDTVKMKKPDTDTAKPLSGPAIKDLNAEDVELIKTVDRNEDKSAADLGEVYRIWHCNGVPVGVHIHKI
jgi:hypothetical protein